MIRLGAALGAAAMIVGFMGAPASARDFPYCLQGGDWGYPGNCQFDSYEQCMATASGTRAGCDINPVVAFRRQQQPDLTQQPAPRSRRHQSQ
ncbi:DUF3551 domain-containing protein [Rhodopseudomonas sp. HC1]|uniref:DUF3551 domain-containing protein n=1 Tax=Rhodopseudomonas infernalis TaxID=2897386 RepID=UPI001EE7DA35|nr:DUF3551 domain-containing protein [Rhodopseudomonas infernalis]MCG6204510.1 DUF3551 domain-containing protein [Rhodopseudomonas infernalis]